MAENRNDTKETWSEKNIKGRFRKYTYDELIIGDKTSLDIFWLKDDNYIDLDSLPEPEILAQEIIYNIEDALSNFKNVMESLNRNM